jgi:AcrR family transcriptional regulator
MKGMVDAVNFHDTVQALLRTRLLDAVAAVGVSRQTLYNEFGSKAGLAEVLIMREVETFLAGVGDRLDAHHDQAVEAIAAAVEYTLRAAADNPLLKAILTANRGGSDALLPLITTHSEPLQTAATAMLTAYAREHWAHLGLDDEQLDIVLDSLVRLTISRIVLCQGPPEQAARELGWLVSPILTGATISAVSG